MNSWTKLRDGSWGVKTHSGIQPGTKISVKNKDGKIRSVQIKSVLWEGDGSAICSIVNDSQPRQAKIRGGSFGYWECRSCGEENLASARSCWECGCGR